MKKIISVLLVVCMVFTLTACASTSGTKETEKQSDTSEDKTSEEIAADVTEQIDNAAAGKEGLTVGYAMAAVTTNPILISANELIKNDCDKKGYKLITAELQPDSSDTPDVIENLISAGCDMIILHVIDTDVVKTKMQELKDAGVMVGAVITDVEGSDYCLYMDNYELGYEKGKMAGEWLKEKFDGKGEVAVLGFDQTPEYKLTGDGMEDGLHEVCPDAEVVLRTEGVWADQCTDVAETMLTAYPDVKVIITIGELGATAVYEAYKAAGKGNDDSIGIFTSELTETGEAALRENGIYRGTLATENDLALYDFYKTMLEAAETDKVDAAKHTLGFPMVQVTPDNVDEYMSEYRAKLAAAKE